MDLAYGGDVFLTGASSSAMDEFTWTPQTQSFWVRWELITTRGEKKSI
jgi:hypothetical protein